MIYEAWESEDRAEIHFSTSDGIAEQRATGVMPGEWRLLHRFEAASWEDASARHHELMGWEKYKPMEEQP